MSHTPSSAHTIHIYKHIYTHAYTYIRTLMSHTSPSQPPDLWGGGLPPLLYPYHQPLWGHTLREAAAARFFAEPNFSKVT